MQKLIKLLKKFKNFNACRHTFYRRSAAIAHVNSVLAASVHTPMPDLLPLFFLQKPTESRIIDASKQVIPMNAPNDIVIALEPNKETPLEVIDHSKSDQTGYSQDTDISDTECCQIPYFCTRFANSTRRKRNKYARKDSAISINTVVLLIPNWKPF